MDLCQQETEYAGNRVTAIDMLWLSIAVKRTTPQLSGLKGYFVTLSPVSVADWAQGADLT